MLTKNKLNSVFKTDKNFPSAVWQRLEVRGN